MENERAKDHWTGRGLSEGDFDRGLRTQMTRMPFIRAIRAIRGLVLEPSGQAGRQGDSVRELAGDFVGDECSFAEPTDRAIDEDRGQVAVSLERRGRAPRHGSYGSLGVIAP